MEEKEKKQNNQSPHSSKSPAAKSEKGHAAHVPVKEEGKNKVDASLFETAKAELEKATAQSAANLEGWQRERAEFSNYKRRVDREQLLQRQYLTGEVIKKYLVILDDLELALKNQPKEGEGAAWAEGINLITRKLQSIIDSEGIERINQDNVPFDPNLHEAISNEENPAFESGQIIEVVRQGYKLGDRILRPAMVRVAR
jgi:molecular chaperone GrpE